LGSKGICSYGPKQAFPACFQCARNWSTSAHTWQATAAGGTSIGIKAMVVAAKTLALTGADLFANPATIAAAKAEFDKSRGPGFVYKPLIGDRAPPLDYRKNPSSSDAG